MKRKIIIGCLIGIFGLSLSACGNTEKEASNANTRTNDTSAFVEHHNQHSRYFNTITYDKIHNQVDFHIKPSLKAHNVPPTIKHNISLEMNNIHHYAHNPKATAKIIK